MRPVLLSLILFSGASCRRPATVARTEEPVLPVKSGSADTHMGNGCLPLYELRDRSLVRLLSTRARTHLGRLSIKEAHLNAMYDDMDLDGCSDADLTGTSLDEGEELYGPDPESKEGPIGKGPASEVPCRKVFLWRPKEGRFVESLELRQGIDTAIGDY